MVPHSDQFTTTSFVEGRSFVSPDSPAPEMHSSSLALLVGFQLLTCPSSFMIAVALDSRRLLFIAASDFSLLFSFPLSGGNLGGGRTSLDPDRISHASRHFWQKACISDLFFPGTLELGLWLFLFGQSGKQYFFTWKWVHILHSSSHIGRSSRNFPANTFE